MQRREARWTDSDIVPRYEPDRVVRLKHPQNAGRDGAASAMLPADLLAHRANRARQGRRALAATVRQAALNGTVDQRLELARVVQAVDDDSLAVDDAHAIVAAIRAEQQPQAKAA